MNYYIFKTDNKTGKTEPICNGSHDTKKECKIHWQAYMYGFMDGAYELLGAPNFGMTNGLHELSFHFTSKDKDTEYFMLFNREGRDLICKLTKESI